LIGDLNMKILQVFNFFSLLHGGGTVEVVYKLSRALAQRGHEVMIYTSNFELDQEYIDTLPEVRVHLFRCLSSLAKFYLMPGMVGEVRKHLQDFDIVHLHCSRSFQNIVIHHYARKYGVPYLLQAHGALPRIMTKQGLKKLYDILWGYRLLEDTSRVIAVADIEAEQYRSMGVSKDKIEIVPNGIDWAEFDNLPRRGGFRKKWSIDDSQRIVLYLGRIHKIKGLDLLVKAFAEIDQEINNIKLAIIGPDDGYLPTLRKLIRELGIEEQVLLTGPLYGRDKLNAYVDADIYVLPSFYEIFGVTVLEACACGTPVIVTDRCSIANIIDSQAGLVVPYDKKSLGKAILALLNNDNIRRDFGNKGRLLVREKFQWDKIMKQMERVYLDCLSPQS